MNADNNNKLIETGDLRIIYHQSHKDFYSFLNTMTQLKAKYNTI